MSTRDGPSTQTPTQDDTTTTRQTTTACESSRGCCGQSAYGHSQSRLWDHQSHRGSSNQACHRHWRKTSTRSGFRQTEKICGGILQLFHHVNTIKDPRCVLPRTDHHHALWSTTTKTTPKTTRGYSPTSHPRGCCCSCPHEAQEKKKKVGKISAAHMAANKRWVQRMFNRMPGWGGFETLKKL